MAKHWTVGYNLKKYETYEDAEKALKKLVGAKKSVYSDTCIDEGFLYETVAVATAPVPNVEVVKL